MDKKWIKNGKKNGKKKWKKLQSEAKLEKLKNCKKCGLQTAHMVAGKWSPDNELSEV